VGMAIRFEGSAMTNKFSLSFIGLASLASIAMVGCGGGGSTPAVSGGTVSLTGGIVFKNGVVQEAATATSSPIVISVMVDGKVIDSYLPKNTSVDKGEAVNVIMQDSPIIRGLRPASTNSVELNLPNGSSDAAVATGLYLQPDGTFDLAAARTPGGPRVPKTLTVKRRRDTTNWFHDRIVFAGAQELTDGAGHTLSIKNGITIDTWDQYFTPAGTLTQYVTMGQPTWAGTIPANGGDSAGAVVTFSMPKRSYDNAAIYAGWDTKLTIKVSQQYQYDQTLATDADGVVTFRNLTHEAHDNIPKSGVSQLSLDIIKGF
jgi:hypothetical protein